MANIIGKRIKSRINGTALEDSRTTFANTLPNYAGSGLPKDNNFESDLSGVGITLGVYVDDLL